MPVPLAPYPTPTVPVTPPAANGKLLNSVLVLVCKECRILFAATYKKKKEFFLRLNGKIGYRDHTSQQPRNHQAILIIRCTKPASVLRVPKPFTLSSRSNFRMLCRLQCRHSCSTSSKPSGTRQLRELSDAVDVPIWSTASTSTTEQKFNS
ncbi:hypothetical protein RHMOL_Rhmol07G0149100 [Rhododendron molle]|uniref:Uncharacterized protein n=1 Tax=Rhododendron molle TaxID=49168 RepID=A0ACC0N1W1_RHOML|nr:hypothetical protein RHMOL_Rhmol07G0149100 [Rhododendron molle]